MSSEQIDSDEAQCWQQFRQGNQKALANLFITYYDRLYRYGFRLYGDDDAVKDCIQELFLKLWRKRESIGEVRELTPYLYKALRRCIVDSLRAGPSHFRLWQADDEARLEVCFSHEEFLISEQIDAEQRSKLTRALNKLTKRQREAIHLRYFDGFEPGQIAQIMGLTEQSVYNLLYRSVQSLRDHFFLLVFLSQLPAFQTQDF